MLFLRMNSTVSIYSPVHLELLLGREAYTIQLTCNLFIVELLQSAPLAGKRKSQVCNHVFRGVYSTTMT